MAGPYESKPGNARNGQVHHHPGLWRTATRDYAIIIGLDWRPVLWWRDRDDDSTWQSRDMTGEFGLLDAHNSHNAMAMGVTWDGRATVVGNMHHERIKWWWSAPGDPSSGWELVPLPAPWASWSEHSTYQALHRLSDGTLLMLCDHSPIGVVGRSWSCLRLPAGATAWQATSHPNGNFMTAPAGGTPDRSYVLMSLVEDDVLHIVGVWRMVTQDSTTQTRPYYARSRDAGETWETVTGAPLASPFTYPATLDDAEILLDGESTGRVSRVSGIAIAPTGEVLVVGTFSDQTVLLSGDENGWDVATEIPSNAFTWEPVPVDFGGGQIRIVGRRGGQLRAHLGLPPGPYINFGAINTGSAEETLWRSTAIYTPFIEDTPTGRLVSWMVPDGDLPRIRTARTYRHQPST